MAPIDKGWVIQLSEYPCWASADGRTLVVRNAKLYRTERGAQIALGMRRRHRRWSDARIYCVASEADITPGGDGGEDGTKGVKQHE
jgi:hypothetical protein